MSNSESIAAYWPICWCCRATHWWYLRKQERK